MKPRFNQEKEHPQHVRKTSGVPIVQPVELQRVLQSKTLRICQKRQGLSKKKETQTEAQKRIYRIKKGQICPFRSNLYPPTTPQPNFSSCDITAAFLRSVSKESTGDR
jgi:hypothetical protein